MIFRLPLSLISISLLISLSFGMLGNKGACQLNKTHGIDVQKTKIEGTWFLLCSSASYLFQSPKDKCNIIEFSVFTNSFLVENKSLDINNEVIRFVGTSTYEQPGTLNIVYSDFSQDDIQVQFFYMNNDFSVSALIGCNNSTFLGSSDVLILSRERSPNFKEIEKATEEAERRGFDVSDLVLKSNTNTGCNSLI